MSLDVTTLAFAVDSSQVTSAAAALDKMAASGASAEVTAAKLAKASIEQGRALNTLTPAANKGALAFKTLAEAQEALGPAAAAQLAAAGAFGAVASQANAATAAVQQLGTEAQRTALSWREMLSQRMGPVMQDLAAQGLPHKEAHTQAIRQIAAEWKRYKEEGVAAQVAVSGALASTTAQTVQASTAVRSLNSASAAIAGASARTSGLSALAADAARAKSSVIDLSTATTSLGASSFVNFDKVTTSLGATAARADEAARAVHRLQDETARLGALSGATTSFGAAVGPASSLREAIARRDVEEQARRQVDPRLAVAPALGAAGAAGARAVVSGNEAIGKSAKLAAFQQQQLGFQLHDFFVQVASGQSPITAFVQQGSQLSGTFGGAGNAFRAVTALITPMRLAMGGAAAAVGALGLAFYEGSQQSKAFADAIVLSGNFAGQTEGKINALTQSVSANSNISRASAREFAQALISTGQIGPELFDKAAVAAARFGEATGQTAAEVAKDFASMSQGAAKWAIEHNRSLNFLSAAQIQSIKEFEDQGRAIDAQRVIYDALNGRLKGLETNLGTLQQALKSTGKYFSDMWDQALAVGRTETVESKLADVDRKLRFLRENGGSQSRFTELANERNGLLREQGTQVGAALAKAADALAQKEAIDARTSIDAWAKRGKAASLYGEELAKLKRGFEKNALAGTPVPKDIQDAALKGLKEAFTSRKGAGRADHEPDQIRREDLANRLDAIQAAFQRERDALAFNNRFLEGEYRAGNKSLADFWDERRATTAAGVAGEIAELEKKKGAIQEDLDKPLNKPGGVKDPSERLKLDGDIKKLTAQQEALRTKAAQDATLANQEEAASFKQLADQVLNYRANLLQLQGDEVGAAKLRAQAAIEQAGVLAKQATPRPTTGTFARADRGQPEESLAVDVAGFKRATDQQITLTEAKTKTSQVNQILQIEEERIALAQRSGAISENQALRQTGEARAKIIPDLERIVQEQEKIAAQIENKDNWQLQIDTSRARLELEKLKGELDPLKDKFDNLFKDAGASLFSDLSSGKSLKSALLGFANTIGAEINKTASRELSEMVFGKGGPLGGAGGFLSDLFGGKKKSSSAADALTGAKPQVDTSAITASLTNLQTTGADPATSALVRLQQAADAAAVAIGQSGPAVPALGITGNGTDSTALPTGDFARFDRGQTGESAVANLFRDAARSSEQFGSTNADAAKSVLQLAQAATRGQGALSQLPSIIQSIIAAASASGGGGGGGIGGFLGSLFGGGGGGTFTGTTGLEGMSPDTLALFFHSGGVVGQTSDRRPVAPGVFANAGKYHRGGIVGRAAAEAARLSANEVPAILMGGPKGTREEVLHASDPRHRDNIAPAVLAALQRAPAQVPALLSAPAANQGAVPRAAPRQLPALLQSIKDAPGEPGRAFALSVVAGVGGKGGNAIAGRGGDASAVAGSAFGGVGGDGGPGGKPGTHLTSFMAGSTSLITDISRQSERRDSVLRETMREQTRETNSEASRVSTTNSASSVFTQAAGVPGAPGGPGGMGGVGGHGIGAAGRDGSSLSQFAFIAVPAAAAVIAQAAHGVAAPAAIAGAAGAAGTPGTAGAGGSGGEGGAAGAVGVAASFHLGGIVGRRLTEQPAAASMFEHAAKYHSGGTVLGRKEIPGLRYNEVPAILLRNEEVLTARDPRHRDNLAPALMKHLDGAPGAPGGTTLLNVIARAYAGSGGRGGDASAAVGAWQSQERTSPVAQMLAHDRQTRQLSPLTRALVQSPATVKSLISELSKESDFRSVASLREMHVAGARELGGTVSSGGLYRINERRPEVLEVSGRQYLMMGAQDGRVKDAPGASGDVYHLNVSVNASPGMGREHAMNIGRDAGRQVQAHMGKRSRNT
jgi:phage-related minor tail protein